mgnify:FL=1
METIPYKIIYILYVYDILLLKLSINNFRESNNLEGIPSRFWSGCETRRQSLKVASCIYFQTLN